MDYSKLRSYQPKPQPKKHTLTKIAVFVILVGLAVVAGLNIYSLKNVTTSSSSSQTQVKSSNGSSIASGMPTISPCASNTFSQLLVVSISRRETWACDGNKQMLSTPVITGYEGLASDLTPLGTYHILLKQTKVSLVGCDTDNPTDCWNDYVNYDLIFLYNQYGHYDFHDATWRKPNDFGNISQYSTNASHGCVETPLNAMAWIYNWANVGTTVEIQA